MSVNNESIQGNLSVSRDATVGGRMNVRGNTVFDHNVVIKGWFDAKNIKGPCKGLYASLEDLKEAYPKPMSGWYALVGNALPTDVYRAENGEWVATGQQGGEINLYLDQLEKDVSDLRELLIDGTIIPESVSFDSESDKATMSFSLRKLDGTNNTYTISLPVVTEEKAGMMSANDKQIVNLYSIIKNEEYVMAIVDYENHLLFGIKTDGKPYFPKNDMYHVVQNEEYLYAVVDAEDKLLIGIRHDGEIIEGKIPLNTRKEIQHVKTELSRNVLAVEMDRATGRIIGYTGNDSRIRSCEQDRVTGKITINQIIE